MHHTDSEWSGSGSDAVWRRNPNVCSVIEGGLPRLR